MVPDASPESPLDAFFEAVDRDDLERVRALWANGAFPRPPYIGKRICAPLLMAAAAGRDRLLRFFLTQGENHDGRNATGQTALHLAAFHDYPVIATILLAAGASLEARDQHGDTPLHRAVYWGNTDVATVLLAAGADPESVSTNDKTPFDLNPALVDAALARLPLHQLRERFLCLHPEHRAQCPSCRERLQEIKEIGGAPGESPQVTNDPQDRFRSNASEPTKSTAR